MIKKIAVAATAVLITASPLAYAAETSSTVGMRTPSAADLNALTDAHVGVIKAALQLTPDQEKYWPAVEEAIRASAKNRQARLERVAELRNSSPKDESCSARFGNPLRFNSTSTCSSPATQPIQSN
jgi:hypothetical protein